MTLPKEKQFYKKSDGPIIRAAGGGRPEERAGFRRRLLSQGLQKNPP